MKVEPTQALLVGGPANGQQIFVPFGQTELRVPSARWVGGDLDTPAIDWEPVIALYRVKWPIQNGGRGVVFEWVADNG